MHLDCDRLSRLLILMSCVLGCLWEGRVLIAPTIRSVHWPRLLDVLPTESHAQRLRGLREQLVQLDEKAPGASS